MKALIRPLFIASVGLAAVCLSSCNTVKHSSGTIFGKDFDPPITRPTSPSNVKVKVSTGAQRVYVMEGNKVLMATPCSVGAGGTTGSGTYRIQYKEAKRRRQSEPDRGYPMAFWQEWKPAYGLHWGFVKPYPCTHGCIRLPMKSAAKLFALTQTGTPLIIAASHPEDATIGKTLPVIDDGPLPNPSHSYLLSPQFFADAEYKGTMFKN
jgi:lipoprotein-anchoring transpeptidase ErfK/SrfK